MNSLPSDIFIRTKADSISVLPNLISSIKFFDKKVLNTIEGIKLEGDYGGKYYAVILKNENSLSNINLNIFTTNQYPNHIFVEILEESKTGYTSIETLDYVIKFLKSVLTKFNETSAEEKLILDFNNNSDEQFFFPQKINKVFNYFCINSNRNSMNKYDWEEFFQFIYLCHIEKYQMDIDKLKKLLLEKGFSTRITHQLISVYNNFRKMMSTQTINRDNLEPQTKSINRKVSV